jgi:penicillin G amidase
MAAVQMDTTSLGVQQFLKFSVPMINSATRKHIGATLWQGLSEFDGVMRPDTGSPLLASAWWRHLSKRLFADDLGDKAYLEAADASMVWLPMIAALEGKSSTDWCDDIRTPARETCDQQVNAALLDATADLHARYGNASQWQWGTAHALQADHAALGKVPVLGGLTSSTVPLGGDSFTIVQLKNFFGREATPYRAAHGPGYRGIFDLSVPIANVMQSTGQSGIMGSELYKNLTTAWSKGDTLSLPVGAQGAGNVNDKRWVLKALR